MRGRSSYQLSTPWASEFTAPLCRGSPSLALKKRYKWYSPRSSRLLLIPTVPDAQTFHSYPRQAFFLESQLPRGSRSDINNASGDKGPPIVKAHLDGLSIGKVCHFDAARQGQGLVGATDVKAPNLLAEGRVAPLETKKTAFVIPGGNSRFFVAKRLVDAHGMVTHPLDRVGAGHIPRVTSTTTGH